MSIAGAGAISKCCTGKGGKRFAADLIRWQKQHGRHTLPWQNTRDAYRIWLSEVMLQQTQVTTVIPYYQRFLDQFPDVRMLAAAPVEQVMALWSGLGYYSRARNLHKCAQRVVAEFGGVFPDDPELLKQLPGIGRSTAAAIAVFSSGAQAAILDGNVKRVLTRFCGIEGYPGAKPLENALWELAEAMLPTSEVEAYTQGLMDLGATLCTRSKPSCERCPVAKHCVALATQRVDTLPTRKPRKAIPERRVMMLLIVHDKQILLERRPDHGIWGGLLSLPEIEWSADEEHGIDAGLVSHSLMPLGNMVSCQPLAPLSHGFTHFRLHIFPCLIRLEQKLERAGQDAYLWCPIGQQAQLALPAPVRKLLAALSL